MLVAARAVHVTVLEFLGAGFPHLGDFHVKIEGHTGERVISIQAHLIRIDAHHGDDVHALFALGLELHARLAIGVSCVVLVLLGAALGVILRSGPLLSAFGVSAIPAVLCLMTIFTGKHMGEQGGADLPAGIAFLWSGIAVIALADLLIYRNLLKR